VKIDYPRAGRSGLRRWLPSGKQLGVVVASSFVALVALMGVGYAMVDVPEPNDLVTAQTTVIRYRDGAEIGRIGALNRQSVPLAELPQHVQHAVLAAENRSFFSDPGISPTGIARAFWNNLRGNATQGGSTITQQYAKNALLTQERTWSRKLREAVIAVKLDREFSKEQILEDYLNTIYFGRGAYGVETAAQAYFGRSAGELTVEQGAVLAAMIQAPSAFDPEENRERLEGRWRYVLDGMVGEGWLGADEAAGAEFPKIRKETPRNRLSGSKGYLIRTVEKELLSRGFTEQDITQGGLDVTTTFVQKAQRAADEAVRDQLPDDVPKNLRVALAAVRPGSGEVVAMYGGKDYVDSPFNNATQGVAQAGSTFKPFALAAGLEQGIALTSRFDGSSPRTFPGYSKPVSNFGLESFGTIDLLQATANSVNTVYVDLGLEVGPKDVVDAAVRAGIPEDTEGLEPNGSVVLGSASPHPIEVAEAFATFAAQGRHADWFTVLRVKGSNGAVRYEADAAPARVFAPDVMADLSYALQGVVESGSGFEARNLGRPSAGRGHGPRSPSRSPPPPARRS